VITSRYGYRLRHGFLQINDKARYLSLPLAWTLGVFLCLKVCYSISMIAPARQYTVGLRFGAPVPYPPFWHPGIDLLPYPGSDRTLISPDNGLVVARNYSVGAGNLVDINLDNGLACRLCHLVSPAIVSIGQRVTQGQPLGVMGATGLFVYPRGFVHLHYVIFKNHNRVTVIDPAPYLTGDPNKIDISGLFTQIWHRLAAQGEKDYFQRRLDHGSITDRNGMIAAMTKWYNIVYPNGHYSAAGDDEWQKEKVK
jgi:hypothetical protein